MVTEFSRPPWREGWEGEGGGGGAGGGEGGGGLEYMMGEEALCS